MFNTTICIFHIYFYITILQMKERLHEEKIRRRQDVATEAERRKYMENKLKAKLDDMHEWLEEMAEEVRDAKREAKKAAKGKERVDSLANKRVSCLTTYYSLFYITHTELTTHLLLQLIMIKELKDKLAETRDNLADESNQRAMLERMRTIGIQIKKERKIGRRGGSSRWPVHIVLLICELLVNGTPPSAIRPNLQSTSAVFTGCEAEELPCVNFIRQCRVVVQNINATLSAMRLGRADVWHQMFTDGTTRRQTAFQDLIIALMEDDVLDPVIVSSCIILENETSEGQLNAILTQVRTCVVRVTFTQLF